MKLVTLIPRPKRIKKKKKDKLSQEHRYKILHKILAYQIPEEKSSMTN